MMLLLLLSALTGLTAGELVRKDPFNITRLPISFYGQEFNFLAIETSPSDNFSMCFVIGYEAVKHCLVFDKPTSGDGVNGELRGQTDPEGVLSIQFPAIPPGHWYFTVPFAGEPTMSLYLLDFGDSPYVVITNTNTVVTLLLNGISTAQAKINQAAKIDLSGCEHEGKLYEGNEVIIGVLNNCTKLICSTGDLMTSPSTCKATEECIAGSCITPTKSSLCTLVGPSIIAYNGSNDLIRTRCIYNLLQTPSFNITGAYRERREKGLSFPDSVTLLQQSQPPITIMQDGTVQANGKELALNSTAQMFHSAELSKDQSGITATVVQGNTTTTVLYDGYMVQIQMSGGIPLSTGLCEDTRLSTKSRSQRGESAAGCGQEYSKPSNRSDCNAMATRCDLLKEAPFTACNALIDPTPYIAQCKAALCLVEAQDGLDCGYHEAYARACSLYPNGTVAQDWRNATGCSAPAAFGFAPCASNEFALGGRCVCRALFAEPFKTSGALGEPTVCDQSSASVSLYRCLLSERNVDPSALHLNNPNCTGQADPQTGKVTFTFDSTNTCGTVVTTNSSQITYKNAIRASNTSSEIITRRDQVVIDFSCYYTQPEMKTVAFRIKDSSVVLQIVSGAWNYTLNMTAFSDAALTLPLSASDLVLLNQKIFVELKTDGLSDSSVAVVTDSCWATNVADSAATLKYELIKNGCANKQDATVMLNGNGVGTSNSFSFNTFAFSGKASTDFYLHCELNLCDTTNNNCVPSCGGRRRRSARNTYEQEAAFISMSWTN